MASLSLWALVGLVGLVLNKVVEGKEYYDWNYRNENPYYKYSGKDVYEYHNEGKWRTGRSTFFNEFDK